MNGLSKPRELVLFGRKEVFAFLREAGWEIENLK